MTGLRTVSCDQGPMDGAAIDVPADLALPDTISFPHYRSVAKRDVYRLVKESDDRAGYLFDHVEVAG